jgi:hypothetical protein
MDIEEIINEVVMFSGRFPDVSTLDVFDFVDEVCGLRTNEETAVGRVIIEAYDHGTEAGMQTAKAYGLLQRKRA